MRNTSVFGIALVTTLLLGCGNLQTYPGDPLPPEEVALLLSDNGFFENPEIVSYTAYYGDRAVGDYESIELLPGEHTIAFGLKGKNYRGDLIRMTISVEAGKTYASRPVVEKRTRKTWLGEAFKDGTWDVEIYETETGDVIATSQTQSPGAGRMRKDTSSVPIPP